MIGKMANNTVVTYVLEPFEEGTRFAYAENLPRQFVGHHKFFGRLGKGMLERRLRILGFSFPKRITLSSHLTLDTLNL